MKSEPDFRRLGWRLDHGLFLALLTAVKDVRNELMHFSTDPLTADQLHAVEGLVNLLRTVDPRA